MSPDMDALPELFRRGKVSASNDFAHDHRELLHYPIVFLLFGFAFVFIAPFWGWMFLIAVMLHFVNDFYGTGWGIALLWPFTNRRYKLLGRRANLLKRILIERGLWNTLPQEERKLRFVVSWSHDELRGYIKKYGEEKWIDTFYLTLNWISGTEYALFLFSLYLVATIIL